jgi:hypothetical protein
MWWWPPLRFSSRLRARAKPHQSPVHASMHSTPHLLTHSPRLAQEPALPSSCCLATTSLPCAKGLSSIVRGNNSTLNTSHCLPRRRHPRCRSRSSLETCGERRVVARLCDCETSSRHVRIPWFSQGRSTRSFVALPVPSKRTRRDGALY